MSDTDDEFQTAFIGPAGKSAYQSWLSLGNTGTEADFIASLQGGSGGNIDQLLALKVDKVTGKQLSTEDYTTAEKTKLALLEGPMYRGTFATFAALTAGVTSPQPGNYADVDGVGVDAIRYIWDASDLKWIQSSAPANSLTASQIKVLYESNANTNAYPDSDKAKVVSVAQGATANSTDAQLRDRSTHTGTQAISTVNGLQAALTANGVIYATASQVGTTYLASASSLLVVTDGNPAFLLFSDKTNFRKVTDNSIYTPPVIPTAISVTPNPISVPAGSTVQLVPTITPSNSTNQNVTYTSSNTAIATVSSIGLVTGVAQGAFSITATTVSGGATQTISGTTTASLAVVKAVGRWNPMNDTVNTAAAGLTTYYFPVKMITGSGDATGLALNFPGWYAPNTNTGMVTNIGNDINIIEVSLQTSTTSAPVMFSGVRTGVIPNGGNLISDMVTPSALGFTGGVIPVGTVLWLKGKATIPSGGKVPASPRNLYGQSNLAGWFYDSTATTVPSVDSLANSTTGYTGTKPIDAGNLYAPILIGTFSNSATKVYAGWGDSIESGYNDLNPGYLGGGFFQRALALFPTPAASINFGISGATSPSLSTDSRIQALFKYAPDGLDVMVGTNDFGISSPPTASSIIANIDKFIAFYKGATGVKSGVKAVVHRLLPRTTSTDSFVTEANQTINQNWNPGEVVAQFNALITTTKYDAILTNDVVRGTDVSKWIVNGTANSQTGDGTHPSGGTNGAPLLASTYTSNLQSAWA